jgi:hypothetical protein
MAGFYHTRKVGVKEINVKLTVMCIYFQGASNERSDVYFNMEDS